MKKLLFVAALAVSSLSANAQDILVRKGGDVENVKVLEVTPTEVKYKKASNPNGPTFSERRSDLISVKYENGETQKFNERAITTTSSSSSSSSSIFNPKSNYIGLSSQKKFTHEIDLYLQDGWGVGYQFRKDFRFWGVSIASVSYMSGFNSPADCGQLNLRLPGLRAYTPAYKWIRGYIDVNFGYSLVYEKEYNNYYHVDDFYYYYGRYYDDNVVLYHFFGLDLSAGVQLHKHFAVGWNCNFIFNDDYAREDTFWARIAYIF